MIEVHFNKLVAAPWSGSAVTDLVRLVARQEKRIKGEVEVNVIGDEEMRDLNKSFRRINRPTDVLAFAWQETAGAPGEEWLGQIYIDYPQVKRQAREQAVGMEEEFARLITHGLLHLVGHDHDTKQAERKMFALQEAVVKSWKKFYG